MRQIVFQLQVMQHTLAHRTHLSILPEREESQIHTSKHVLHPDEVGVIVDDLIVLSYKYLCGPWRLNESSRRNLLD